jgi:hypothetical protein
MAFSQFGLQIAFFYHWLQYEKNFCLTNPVASILCDLEYNESIQELPCGYK